MSRMFLAAAFVVFLFVSPHYSLASVSVQAEQHPTNLLYIFAAFMAIWAGFFLYTMFMAWRERKLRRDVEELKVQLRERAKKS